MQFHKIALISMVFLFPILAAAGAGTRTDVIGEAFERLYSNDFARSQKILTAYTQVRPSDPLAHATRATALLYSVLSNAGLLDTRQNSSKKKPVLSALDRQNFLADAARAEELAKENLTRNPRDRDSLFALALAESAQRDFAALVDKRYRDSMEHAKVAQRYALQLLQVNPTAHDAYFITGFNEYLVGSIPAILRWAIRMEDCQGNQQRGIERMEIAARSGRYLRPFARMMLASLYKQRNRKPESDRMLLSLADEFPENPVFQKEAVKIRRGF